MIRAGNLRTRLAFYKQVESKNPNGETIVVPQHAFTRRVEELDNSTDTGIVSDGRDVQSVMRVRLRYSKSITEDLLVIHNGYQYEITLVSNTRGRNIELILTLVSYRE